MEAKTCEFCDGVYRNLGRHQATCKRKKKWEDMLDKEGIIEKGDILHLSGGMKVFLAMDRGGEDEESNRFRKNLEEIEKKNGIHIDYDYGRDKILVTGGTNV